ncbi:MAG: SipW-dependent-type signal peptide-containing protein [Oscillibacter sp.]|nr:SipW-dependent-type signal peptide-containing protein [Oscillibacter sp.]
MNNKRATKRALLTSVMALVMCVVMLVGTTFAWFTDTASTGVNKIQAGNLDVELLMHNGEKYVNISEEKEPIFGSDTSTVAQNNNLNTLWEPGKTQVAYLAIENKGNLALKYKVALNVTNPAGGKDLYKVMQYAIVPDAKLDSAPVQGWTTGGNVTVGQQAVSGEVSLPVGVTHYFALLVHMDELAGNNYQNGKVDFDLTVYATQDTVENDSFNNQYDKDAPIVYPAGVTSASFDAATSVYYYSTYGGTSVKTAVGEDISSHPAVVAYVNNSNVVEYAADLRAALMNGATEVFCKKDAVVSTVGSHVNVVRDVTIYANGADFKGGDLSIHAGGGNYVAPANNENTINIYNAKNLTVWGEPQAVGRVWNVNFYDCANDGSNFFMYRGDKDKTDTFHLTMINCTANGYSDSTVHATADGSIVIKNCTFTNNCAPVNIAHKQSGTLTVTVEDSKFVNCGKVNPANDYFAPARFVNNSNIGTLNVTLKNNTFTDTIGTNGDILLGDYRATGKSFAFTTNITTDHPVMVKSSVDAASSYSGGTINVANH